MIKIGVFIGWELGIYQHLQPSSSTRRRRLQPRISPTAQPRDQSCLICSDPGHGLAPSIAERYERSPRRLLCERFECELVIQSKSNRAEPIEYDRRAYKRCNLMNVSTPSNSFDASRPPTRKPQARSSPCYASGRRGSGSKLSTRPLFILTSPIKT